MMALFLGQPSNAVHEVHSLQEVLELEPPHELPARRHVPFRDLLVQPEDLLRLERRGFPRARLAMLPGKLRHHALPSIRSTSQSSRRSHPTPTCCIASRSRTVTVRPVTDSPSTVIQNGVPASSCRRYRRPIEPPSSKNAFQRLPSPR